MLVAAALAIGVGMILERLVVSRLYSLPEGQVLFATYALLLILDDLPKWIWGGQPLNASDPRDALGQLSIGAAKYPTYDLGLIVLACLLAVGVWFMLTKTSFGRCVSAIVVDREMSASMGINVTRVMTLTFAAGAALGAFAGAVTAPKISIGPGLGVEVIVQAFAVTVIRPQGIFVPQEARKI